MQHHGQPETFAHKARQHIQTETKPSRRRLPCKTEKTEFPLLEVPQLAEFTLQVSRTRVGL